MIRERGEFAIVHNIALGKMDINANMSKKGRMETIYKGKYLETSQTLAHLNINNAAI